jgi:hypothetical protein
MSLEQHHRDGGGFYRMVTSMQEVTPKVVAMAVITAATTCSTVRQTVSLFMA